MKARWWMALLLGPMLMLGFVFVPVIILGVLADQVTSGATGTAAPTHTPPAAAVPVDYSSGSWPEFLAAHYETNGKFDQTATLTGVQVAVLFYDAGCRDVHLVEMVAISGRESGRNPTAYNFHARTTGDISLGLVQENVKDSMYGRLAEAGLSDPRQLLNPVNAAHAAFLLSGGCTNLSPWGGYKGLPNTYGTDMAGAIAAVEAARTQGLIA